MRIAHLPFLILAATACHRDHDGTSGVFDDTGGGAGCESYATIDGETVDLLGGAVWFADDDPPGLELFPARELGGWSSPGLPGRPAPRTYPSMKRTPRTAPGSSTRCRRISGCRAREA